MDLISADNCQNCYSQKRVGLLTFIQLSLGVLQNVTRDAWLVSALGNTVLENLQQIAQILVAPPAELLCLTVLLGEDTKQRDVVLPVVAGTAEVGDTTLDINDLVQQLIVHIALDTETVVESKTGVEGEALEVGLGVDIAGAVLAVLEQFLDTGGAFEVDNGHVGLHGGTVQRGRGGLATTLAGLIPGRGTDSEALRRGYDAVEGVEGGTGDQSRLLFDPELADRVEAVGEDDTLERSKERAGQEQDPFKLIRSPIAYFTYLVAHADLEHRAK